MVAVANTETRKQDEHSLTILSSSIHRRQKRFRTIGGDNEGAGFKARISG